MKQIVKFSYYCLIVTVVCFGVIVGMALWEYYKTDNDVIPWILLAIAVISGFFSLYYAPLSIEVTYTSLCINRSLRIKKIPLSDIASVELCSPTLGAKRICGSGGVCGYWGWFSEKDLGRYFAYYGKASDCFLVTLKDGRKYMLGCENPAKMVEAIKSKLA